jgi:hypothetical protein
MYALYDVSSSKLSTLLTDLVQDSDISMLWESPKVAGGKKKMDDLILVMCLSIIA